MNSSGKSFVVSLLLTLALFVEYTGLFRRVHIPFDLEGYHYSLAQAAFDALRRGEFPLWDPFLYSGTPLAGNLQAALFYPPTWLMLGVNLGRPRLPFSSIEYLLLAHLALGFWIAFLWLSRGRRTGTIAAFAGAAVFAFSGFPVSQITHLGLICTYVWMPLAFWAIDDLAEQRNRSGFLRLVTAFAMALLAGYPATWAALAVSVGAYALARGVVRIPALALALSLGVVAIQLLPGAEAAAVKAFDPKYDRYSAFRGGWPYFLSLAVPNLYDFDLAVEVTRNRGKDFLYLGAFGLGGLALLVTRFRDSWKAAWPFAMAISASLLLVFNPFGIAGRLIEQSNLLTQTLSAWYFLPGAAAPVAALAAMGIDTFLRDPSPRRASPPTLVAIAAAMAWSFYLLSVWAFRWQPLQTGWSSLTDAGAGVGLCITLLWSIRATNGRCHAAAAGAFLLLGMTEYKVFGTSKRLNSAKGASRTTNSATKFPGVDDAALARLRELRPARIILDRTGPDPTDLRHSGLSTPQGFDPLITKSYREFAENNGKFDTNRHFFPPPNATTMRAFGAKFFITTESSPLYRTLMADAANFSAVESEWSYFKVFEFTGESAPYVFLGSGEASVVSWQNASRSFEVTNDSANSAVFELLEQNYPGWTARVDGVRSAMAPCVGPFPCVEVPPGKHRVDFTYRPKSLPWGAAITLASLVLTFLTQRRLATPRPTQG